MRGKHGFAKRALVLGGLLVGTASMALVPTAASARNFIGVDLGPLSVGIGANTPDYVYVPAPAPAPSEVTPPATYAPPVVYQTPPATYQAPVTSYETPTPAPNTTTTTTTYYYTYPSTTTYYSYRPGYYTVPTETATTYYGQ